MSDFKSILTLDSSGYESSITNAIKKTDDFQQAILGATKQVDSLSNQRFEASLSLKDDITQRIIETKRQLSDMRTNVQVMIDAKDEASASLNRIKDSAKTLVSRPFNIVFNAVDKTKSIITSITDSVFNLKTLAAGIVFGATAKKAYDWTIGNAMNNEQYSSTLETVLHGGKAGQKALKWAYKDAASTPFDASQVVAGVTQLATSGLDYKKYLNPLGDAAAAMNKPLEQAIFAMSKLKSGQLGMAVDMFRDFGISNQDWTKAGAKFAKNGSMTGVNPDQAVNMVTKIIQSKYGGLMNRQSGTAKGMMSNIGDTINAMGRGFAGVNGNGQIMKGGLFDNFKKQLENIMPLLSQVQASKAFKTLQKDIGELATQGGNKLTEFLKGFQNPKKIKEYEDTFKDFIKDAKGGIKTAADFGKSMVTVLKTLKPFIDAIAAHPKIFLDLFAGFESVKGAVGIAKFFKDVNKEIGPLFSSLGKFKGSSLGVFKNVGTMAKTAGGGILSFAKSIPGALNTIAGTAKLWVGVIGNVLKGNLLRVVSTVGSGIIKISGTVTAFLAMNPVVAIIMAIIAVVILLYAAWKTNFGGIREKTHAVIEFVKTKIESIKEVFANVKEKVGEFVDGIKKFWKGLTDFIAHPIKGTINLVKNIANKVTGGGAGKNALGTPYWKGGLTWVGEHGPELLDLNAGASIYSNRDSKRMMSGSISIAKLADQIVVREDSDIDKITDALVKKLKKAGYNAV